MNEFGSDMAERETADLGLRTREWQLKQVSEIVVQHPEIAAMFNTTPEGMAQDVLATVDSVDFSGRMPARASELNVKTFMKLVEPVERTMQS